MATTLTRWDPFADFGQIRQRIDRLFDEAGEGQSGTVAARVDVEEKDGELIVKADMPGIKAKDIKIEVADDMLTLQGEHEDAKEQKDKNFLRRERRYRAFRRSLMLPPKVDPKSIEASCHDGVLEVTVPLPQSNGSAPVVIKPKGS